MGTYCMKACKLYTGYERHLQNDFYRNHFLERAPFHLNLALVGNIKKLRVPYGSRSF